MNRGALELQEKLSERGKKADLVRQMSRVPEFLVDPTKVSKWLKGERKPDPKERAWFEDNMGIGWRTWDDELPGTVAEANDSDTDQEAEPKSEPKPGEDDAA